MDGGLILDSGLILNGTLPVMVQAVLSLLLAVACGFVIGIERNYQGRSAGLSTYMLVSAGSCLFVLIGNSIANMDSGRIVAQVVTGIGFLGAGCIIKDGMTVKGFTTAATIWCSAAIGSLCAYQHLLLAIIGTICVLLINLLFHPLALLIERRKAYDRKDDLVICSITYRCPASRHDAFQRAISERSRSRIFAVGGVEWQAVDPQLPPDEQLLQVSMTLKSRYSYLDDLMQLVAQTRYEVNVLAVDWIVQ